MALRIDDISINTVIGKGSEIKGNIKVNGVVRIDGDIDGNLETDGNVIIGENARIRGNINAKSIIVGGIILGNIFANESVKVLANSIVIGDIHRCYNELKELMFDLEQAGEYDKEKDKLVFLGDYIDRGKDSRLVVEFIRGLQKNNKRVIALMGNHEDMLIDY